MIKLQKNNNLILLWCISYSIIWTITTFLLDPTVPYDAIEALNWAMNKEWGSPKNPWLVGFIMRPVLTFSPVLLSFYWYMTHFLAVAVGIYGVWNLAKHLTENIQLRWLSVLSLNLSGIINFDIISFNDNYLLVMFWPWLWVFFLNAIFKDPFWWLVFGLTSGLACMTKYSSFSFIFVVFFLSLIVPVVRRCYYQPLFYFAVFLWLLIISPNIWWLWKNDFASFKWVNSQISPGFTFHALTAALTVFYPLILLSIIFKLSLTQLVWPRDLKDQIALLMMLIPLTCIILFFSFYNGDRITEWLQPYMMPTTALMIVFLKRCYFSVRSLNSILWKLGFCSLLVLIGYISVMLLNIQGAGKKFSGIKIFSQQIQLNWQKKFHQPLRFVGGDYISQWLTFYVSSHPSVITVWNINKRPNIYNCTINKEDLLYNGLLLIGSRGKCCKKTDFTDLLSMWPMLSVNYYEDVVFSPDSNHITIPICLAFIAPRNIRK